MRYDRKNKKKLAFLCFGLVSSLIVTAQESMVSCRYRKTYLGVDNPLDIFVEGSSCSSILVTTDNGKLEKHGCRYVYRPSHEGVVIFTIYKKQNGKTAKIKQYGFPVDSLPVPIVYVGGNRNGSQISRLAFIVQVGISANIDDFDFPRYQVDSFSTAIMHDSTIQFTSHTVGNLFDEKTTQAFRKMEPGSTVLFFNIWVSGAERKSFKTLPLEYVIK
jgi:hypothetical protein